MPRSSNSQHRELLHIYSEALGFLAEHFALYLGSRRVWDIDDEARNEGEVLEGAGKRRELMDDERVSNHEFVIANSDATSTLHMYVPH